MQGGFFLRKKPLSSMDSVNTRIENAVTATPKARLIPLGDRIGELLREGILMPEGTERLRGALTPDGNLRLLPGVFRTDGFFIALIERTA